MGFRSWLDRVAVVLVKEFLPSVCGGVKAEPLGSGVCNAATDRLPLSRTA